VLTRDQLIDAIAGREANRLERTVDVLVSRLRKRLRDDAREPRMIRTVRSEGYIWFRAGTRMRLLPRSLFGQSCSPPWWRSSCHSWSSPGCCSRERARMARHVWGTRPRSASPGSSVQSMEQRRPSGSHYRHDRTAALAREPGRAVEAAAMEPPAEAIAFLANLRKELRDRSRQIASAGSGLASPRCQRPTECCHPCRRPVRR